MTMPKTMVGKGVEKGEGRKRKRKEVEVEVKKRRVSEDSSVVIRRERREVMKQAKEKWEKLRLKANSKEKSVSLVTDLLELLRGKIVQFVFRHDGSRIVQWMLSEGNAMQRKEVMKELMQGEELDGENGQKPFFLQLVCDQYGRHLAFKMMKVCDKEARKMIVEGYLCGHVGELMKSTLGAAVLDHAYQTLLNARQKNEIVTELLYCHERKLYENMRSKTARKAEAVGNFNASIEAVDEEFRKYVLESAHGMVLQLLEKERLCGLQVVHGAVKAYIESCMERCEREKMVELACTIAPLMVHFAHSKEGSWVCIKCIHVLDAKHRKKMMKSVKGYVRKLMEDEYGHRVIVALVALVDDTRSMGALLRAEVLKCGGEEGNNKGPSRGEGKKKGSRGGKSKAEKKGRKKDEGTVKEGEKGDLEYFKQVCMHKYAHLVVLAALVGGDTRYFNPDKYGLIWDEGHVTKFGRMSKKDAATRQREIAAVLEHSLVQTMETHFEQLIAHVWSAAVVVACVKADCGRQRALQMASQLQKDAAWGESKCAVRCVQTVRKVGAARE